MNKEQILLKNFLKIFSILSFVLLTLIILMSNQLDWDYFYTTAETDLRSLLVFGELPFWSYQFCAGVTRLGDPQALSLSPLFLFHLLFGPVWGTKIMMIALFAVGAYFLKKLLELFFDLNEGHLWAFSLCALTSNFFVWHSIAGHVTFSFFNLAIVILYYFFKESQEGNFRIKRAFLLFGAIFILFSGAFYPVVVYLFFPLFPLLLYWSYKHFKKLKYFFITSLVALFFSSYKWASVILYQIQHPRQLEQIDTNKTTLGELIQNLLAPTIPSEMRLWGSDRNQQWSVWEYSFFSSIFILIIFILYSGLLKKEKFHLGRMGLYLGLCAVPPILLSLGYFSTFSPYALSNHYIFSDSLRVHSRFLIAFFFIAIFALAYFWEQIRSLKFASLGLSFALILNLINLTIIFNELSWESLHHVLNSRSETPLLSQQILITPAPAFVAYPATTHGVAIGYCYNPLNRQMALLEKMQKTKEKVPTIKHFLTGNELSTECKEKSYFTANNVFISEACPQKLCLNLNDINPKEKKNFKFNDQEMAYCRGE